MRYWFVWCLLGVSLQATAGDSATRAPHIQIVADFGPAMPYVKYGQAYGLQVDVSELLQMGAEYHFNKYEQPFGLLAGARLGYMHINAHYHSYMRAPYLTPSTNLQLTALGGWRYTEKVFGWLDFVTGMQAGPMYIISTAAHSGSGTVAMYGEASMGFRFNKRITTGLKFFVAPGTYREYYDDRYKTTVGYGVTGVISEVKVLLGKRR